jgi:hypothetical protein
MILSPQVLEALEAGGRWSFVVSFGAICLIAAGGVAIFLRFRKWEKKHIL